MPFVIVYGGFGCGLHHVGEAQDGCKERFLGCAELGLEIAQLIVIKSESVLIDSSEGSGGAVLRCLTIQGYGSERDIHFAAKEGGGEQRTNVLLAQAEEGGKFEGEV